MSARVTKQGCTPALLAPAVHSEAAWARAQAAKSAAATELTQLQEQAARERESQEPSGLSLGEAKEAAAKVKRKRAEAIRKQADADTTPMPDQIRQEGWVHRDAARKEWVPTTGLQCALASSGD